MIRALSILGLVVAVALPVLDYVVFRPRRAAAGVTVTMRRMEWLIHAVFLIALVGMALSGVAPLAFGEPMHGWLLILHMALGEMLSFPNIPVKVTINEYIELAKEYSTPKSRQFINGILDVIAKELKESGSVKKSGRGLIDNK